jgi:malonyl-CoA decarboxylase
MSILTFKIVVIFFFFFCSFPELGESVENPLLLESEIDSLKTVVDSDHSNMCEALKKLLATHEWVSKEHICQVLQSILLRLCSRYLYVEKRRGYAGYGFATFAVKL